MELDAYQDFIIPRSDVDVGDPSSFGLCGLGLAEEALEVVLAMADHKGPAIVADECGDALWYLTAALACLGLKPSEVALPPSDEPEVTVTALALMGAGCRFAGLAKKVWRHRHPLARHRDAMVATLAETLMYLTKIGAAVGLTLEDIADANNAKLLKRYPGGFTYADSLARRDVAA